MVIPIRPERPTRQPVGSNAKPWQLQHPYLPNFRPLVGFEDAKLKVKTYKASCFCGRVSYEVRGDPTSSKICHCSACQSLHGAPFEWVAMFAKENVRFEPSSLHYLHFYNSEIDKGWSSRDGAHRQLPAKVSCSHCRSPVADEGQHMWLAFCPNFGFMREQSIPRGFRYTSHLFYSERCMDVDDNKVKWEGQSKRSNKYARNFNFDYATLDAPAPPADHQKS